MKRFLLCACLSLTPSLAQAADYALVQAGRLLAIPGGAVTENQTVVIKDGVVQSVADGFLTADDISAT